MTDTTKQAEITWPKKLYACTRHWGNPETLSVFRGCANVLTFPVPQINIQTVEYQRSDLVEARELAIINATLEYAEGKCDDDYYKDVLSNIDPSEILKVLAHDTGIVPSKGGTEQTEPVKWKPIETAPINNERLLYLVRFNEDGTIQQLDYDGAWLEVNEGYESNIAPYYSWCSAEGIEEPTHWAYQDDPPPTISVDTVREMQLKAIRAALVFAHNESENAGQNILDIDPQEILENLK